MPEPIDIESFAVITEPKSRRFVESEEAWILQTYLLLRESGYPVDTCSLHDAKLHDIVVAHPSRMKTLRRTLGRRSQTKLVVTASDKWVGRREADVVVVQNMTVQRARDYFVPHWPQPDLLPRDETRGQTVQRVAFKGHPDALHPDLRSPIWPQSLADIGIDWSVAYPTDDAPDAVHPWADYSTCDIIVALRAPTGKLATKPATKLVNAWLAGVPAVLGDEPAYREMRCCELDYLEASNANEAFNAVKRLASDPALYDRMVRHGRNRSAAFDADAVLSRWVATILEIRALS